MLSPLKVFSKSAHREPRPAKTNRIARPLFCRQSSRRAYSWAIREPRRLRFRRGHHAGNAEITFRSQFVRIMMLAGLMSRCTMPFGVGIIQGRCDGGNDPHDFRNRQEIFLFGIFRQVRPDRLAPSPCRRSRNPRPRHKMVGNIRMGQLAGRFRLPENLFFTSSICSASISS